jgi:hypothetical protein
MSVTVQRVVAVVVLVVTGILSLPLAAAVLDDRGAENLIVPVQLLVMAVIGAALALALPAIAPAGATTGIRILTGVGWGVLAALAGLLVFWFLLNGFQGA